MEDSNKNSEYEFSEKIKFWEAHVENNRGNNEWPASLVDPTFEPATNGGPQFEPPTITVTFTRYCLEDEQAPDYADQLIATQRNINSQSPGRSDVRKVVLVMKRLVGECIAVEPNGDSNALPVLEVDIAEVPDDRRKQIYDIITDNLKDYYLHFIYE